MCVITFAVPIVQDMFRERMEVVKLHPNNMCEFYCALFSHNYAAFLSGLIILCSIEL